MRYLALGGIGLVGILVIAGLILPSLPGRQPGQGSRSSQGPGTPVADLGQDHFRPGETAPAGYYNSVPPTSGRHDPSWARCGIHDTPVPEENQVHNLEHGFVLVQYSTKDQAIISSLGVQVRSLPRYPDYLILAPYPRMQQPIALTAWGVVQYLDLVDPQAIQAFAEAYRGRGPELNAPAC
jgi:hypothetical protein